jgi:hypothetical protein
MRRRCFLMGVVVCLVLPPVAARAEAPPDPIRLIPAEASVLVEVPQPRKLIETGLHLDAFQELRKFGPIEELLRSNSYKRFYQLLGHYEKELGANWPELLDQLAGGGVALGFKIAPDQGPAVLVIQGKDEKLQQRFFSLVVRFIEQSNDDEGKAKLEPKDYRKIQTIQVGQEYFVAVAGAALLVSNKEDTLHHAIDLFLDGDAKSLVKASTVPEARKLLPPDCLARFWLNLETVKQQPEAKAFFTSPPGDPAQATLFGGWLDVARRSPYLCAGLHQQKDDFTFTLRMPAGRGGMADFMDFHIPPAGKPATRGLLEPQNALFSTSFYLDLAAYWEKREKLLPSDALKGIEELDKQIAKFLPDAKIGTLLSQTGAYHRFVIVQQDDFGYKTRPRQPQPAYGYIVELRDPEPFVKSMNTILRGTALAVGSGVKLRLIEEKHGDHAIVGYRFPETGKFPNDPDYSRFSYSPCFVAVGNQFVVSSTLELAHELVDLLEKEAKSTEKNDSPSSIRSRLYSHGGIAFARNYEEVLITQAVLGQAVTPADARKQLQAFLTWAEQLGNLDIDSGYTEKDWHMDFKIKLK